MYTEANSNRQVCIKAVTAHPFENTKRPLARPGAGCAGNLDATTLCKSMFLLAICRRCFAITHKHRHKHIPTESEGSINALRIINTDTPDACDSCDSCCVPSHRTNPKSQNGNIKPQACTVKNGCNCTGNTHAQECSSMRSPFRIRRHTHTIQSHSTATSRNTTAAADDDNTCSEEVMHGISCCFAAHHSKIGNELPCIWTARQSPGETKRMPHSNTAADCTCARQVPKVLPVTCRRHTVTSDMYNSPISLRHV
jgi:hypothetical protein